MTKKSRARHRRRGHNEPQTQAEPRGSQNRGHENRGMPNRGNHHRDVVDQGPEARNPGNPGRDSHSPSASSVPRSSTLGTAAGSASSPRRHPHENTRVPLTGRNLQTLLEQSDPAFRSRGSAVALDMDPYDQAHGHGHDDVSLYSHDSRKSSLEFGESNPSSDHSSDSTSLDDVCFPDYYEGRREDGTTENTMWPDLSVLEQYIVEEQEDLKEAMADVPAGVNFQYPVARQAPSIGEHARDPLLQPPVPWRSVYSENVSPSNEESPLLNSVHVDETASVRSTGSSLRVRPKAIQPWEKSREHVPTILNKKNPEAEYRFTYFREDIEGTLHAPTLSGLVATDQPHVPGEQILAKLHELFSPSSSVVSAGQGVDSEMPPSASGTASHSRDASQRLDSPMPSVSEHPASASGNSALGEKHVAPFWLDVTNPSEEEMKVLAKTFGLHPLTTEDIFLGETREKVELFRSYYFICFTSFDIVYERRKQRAMEHEKKLTKLMEYDSDGSSITQRKNGLLKSVKRLFGDGSRSGRPSSKMSVGQSTVSRNNRIRSGELCPLNMYMIIFETGVLTFHFNATPHPINVRRRARMLKDHLTVSTDWICYALIDDITDSFAPMIDSIEHEVYNIEDEIMRMHSGDSTDSDSEGEDSDDDRSFLERRPTKQSNDVFYRRQRSKSIVDAPQTSQFLRSRGKRGSGAEFLSIGSARSTRTKSSASSSQSTSSKIVAWKRKGDMLRRIGECRKRVMSVMRLLGTKADVIKGFSKRFSENETISSPKGPLESKNNRLASKQEILMYLGDIQDHIVTMVQSLNHYEKLLARSHSNYLAQLNIDMTKVNNDTNDILGKVTILGTIVLPINVVTGLWGMNCIVPGQDYDGLMWFNGIVMAISMFSIICYIYAKKVTGL